MNTAAHSLQQANHEIAELQYAMTRAQCQEDWDDMAARLEVLEADSFVPARE
jgi:hypothetical protein